MDRPIIEGVRDYLKDFTVGPVLVDFLAADDGSFSIEETPSNQVVREYVTGDSDRQFLFIFASRMFYATEDNRNNIENLHLFEKLSAWFESNNNSGVFPDLGDTRKANAVTAQTGGYLFAVDGGQELARYQIQCRVDYRQKGC